MMPFAIGQHDTAVHIEAIDLETGVESVQQRRVIGSAQFFGVELPVVVPIPILSGDEQRSAHGGHGRLET